MRLGMGLSLDLGLRLELRFKKFLGSIFPHVDALLDDIRYQQGLAFVGRKKNMRRYRSVIDFLFCELYPEYRRGCFRYYRGRGQLLKWLITEDQRKQFETEMLSALEIAAVKAEGREYIYWAAFRREALKSAAG